MAGNRTGAYISASNRHYWPLTTHPGYRHCLDKRSAMPGISCTGMCFFLALASDTRIVIRTLLFAMNPGWQHSPCPGYIQVLAVPLPEQGSAKYTSPALTLFSEPF